jgi:outer membrane protein OmpA-like peptidoglycan-associated protein
MKNGYCLLPVAAVIACTTAIVYAQDKPTLSARYEIPDFIRSLPANAPSILRDFRGYLIEERWLSDLHPLNTSIFFDSGSAALDDRYLVFTEPAQTIDFDETKITGDAVHVYHSILNVIGSRLRQHPESVISITGCNSHERASGETRSLSQQRAKAVYDYLMNIWGIDPARLKLLPPRDLPKHPSTTDHPRGAMENRRVEITLNSWDMAHAIHYTELRRFPQPDYVKFEMSNGVADSLVVRREIVITRGRLTWHVMTDIGLTETLSPEYNWGRFGDEDSIPEDEVPYTAQFVVYTDDGQELLSNRVEMPVRIFTARDQKRYCFDCRTDIERYSLVLFPFDDARLSSINQRMLEEYVYQDIRPDARITVTGHTDNIGSYSHNSELSEQRAAAVARDMRTKVRKGLNVSVEATGVGEDAPLYSNDLPEGRFYNRMVEVVVESPSPGWPE